MKYIRMKPKKRQKLCYHCEGEVDLDVIVCPFCAADLREEKEEHMGRSTAYARVINEEKPLPPLYQEREEVLPREDESKMATDSILPVVFFTIGTQLFLFGVFSLLFSHRGVIILSWNAAYWFIYCLIGGPLLYFGYKNLSSPK